MNSTTTTTGSSGSRAVIGVALAAVFATGIYVYGFHGAKTSQVPLVARAATPAAPPPPVPEPVAADATAAAPAAAVTPAPADQTPTPAAAPVAPTPAPSVAQNDSSTPPADTATHSKHRVKSDTRTAETLASSGDSQIAKPAAPAVAASTAPAPAAASADGSSTVANNTLAPPAAPVAEAPATPAPAAQDATGTSNPPVAEAGTSDNKISSDVKSQIAATTPNSNVNVTTTNGIVALAGSVPSEDAVNQAKQAALRVDGVKNVDTSGLLVNNQ